nr:MAG TPA: hypothetical protein [Caudoviricetes sp.]
MSDYIESRRSECLTRDTSYSTSLHHTWLF